jgi:hypothetical protein
MPLDASAQMRWGSFALRLIAIVPNLLFATVFVTDLSNAYSNPGDYPFNAQNPGWAYRSIDNYLLSGIVALAALALGAAAVFVLRSWLLKLVLCYALIPLVLYASLLVAGDVFWR